MTPLHKRYPDLLEEQGDPALERVVAELDEITQSLRSATLAPRRDDAIAHALHAQALAQSQAQSNGQRRLWQPKRAAVISPPQANRRPSFVLISAMAVTICVLLAGLAAHTSLLGRVTGGGVGLRIRTQPTTPASALIQSVCGFTVAVTPVSADTNFVILRYSVMTPAGRDFGGSLDMTGTLTDAQGAQLLAVDVGNALPHGSFVAGKWGRYIYYDASAISGKPQTLSLHLAASLYGEELYTDTPPPTTPCESDSISGLHVIISPPVGSGMPEHIRDVNISGPLTFDFTLPYTAGRVVNGQQTVTVGGTTLTLNRVVAAPSAIRFLMTASNGSLLDTTATLTIDGKTIRAHPLDTGGYTFPGDLWSQPGTWTLTVTANPPDTTPGITSVPKQAPRGGPWVFTFTLPPAA